MQRLIAIILFIISFFFGGNIDKANVWPEKEISEGATSAEFVFENKTGYRLEIDVSIDAIQRKAIENDGEWVDVPFVQHINEGITKYKLYPNEKTTLHVVFADPKTMEDVPLVSGDYQIKVSYKTSGYTNNQTGTATFGFTVAPFVWQ